MKLYLDTNTVIYLVERNPIWFPKVRARLGKLTPGRDTVAVSDLTIAECLVGPFKSKNQATEADFRSYFADPDNEILSLTRGASELGARLRADQNFALIDSLHLAIATEQGCGLFLTNDAKLARCTAIAVEVLT